MTNTHLSHRHFVAFPLFLALLGISFMTFSGSSSSLRASIASGQEVMQLSDGAQVLLGEDSVLDTATPAPFLRRGSALVRSESIVQIRTEFCDVLALAGAFHIVAGETATTVSAITAPVLVFVSGHRAVVPVGTQMRIAGLLPGLETGFVAWGSARVTTPLPGHFLREQLLALRQFPEGEDMLPAAQNLLPAEESSSVLALPAAQERAREEWRLAVLGALRSGIERKDDDRIRTILDHLAFSPALSDARSLPVLVTLAGSAADDAGGLRPLLLKFLADRHDLWLLAALHPSLNTGAWTAGIPSLSNEERALLSFSLPAADRSPDGFSPVVMRWWEQSVSAFMAEQEDPLSLIEPLLTFLLPVVEQDSSDGYPERAQELVRSLQSFAEPVFDRLAPELRASLANAAKRTNGEMDLFSSSVSSSATADSAPASSITPSAEPPVDPNERVAIVTSALEQGGALFSLQTKIEPKQDGQSVAVEDILFSSPAGDLPYAFAVDVRTMQVSSIVRSGKLLPYPMALSAFLTWARQ